MRRRAVLATLGVLVWVLAPLVELRVDYHVFGTDKVGQDVFYQILKSIRTALVIGLVTTLVMLPLAVFLGIAAGYFRGCRRGDPVRLHHAEFDSRGAADRRGGAHDADGHRRAPAVVCHRRRACRPACSLALCFILGLTSWTGLSAVRCAARR